MYNTEFTITDKYIDILGHVNNAAYMQIFEYARWEILNSYGKGEEYIKTHKIGPVILQCEIEFKSELKSGDTIQIETIFKAHNRKVFYIEQLMRKDNLICSRVINKGGYIDMVKRKLLNIDDLWINEILVTD